MPAVIRCYIVSFILYNITTIWKLRLKNKEQEKAKSFIQFCWLWWQGTMCVHDYHFQTTKEQICIAQLNQSEPRSAACRAEYYTQLSDPNCMTCWHQWRVCASFILMPCFSRVINRKTLGSNHIYSALSLNSLQFTLLTPQLLSNMHTNYLKVTSNTTESTGKILLEKFIFARLVKIFPQFLRKRGD